MVRLNKILNKVVNEISGSFPKTSKVASEVVDDSRKVTDDVIKKASKAQDSILKARMAIVKRTGLMSDEILMKKAEQVGLALVEKAKKGDISEDEIRTVLKDLLPKSTYNKIDFVFFPEQMVAKLCEMGYPKQQAQMSVDSCGGMVLDRIFYIKPDRLNPDTISHELKHLLTRQVKPKNILAGVYTRPMMKSKNSFIQNKIRYIQKISSESVQAQGQIQSNFGVGFSLPKDSLKIAPNKHAYKKFIKQTLGLKSDEEFNQYMRILLRQDFGLDEITDVKAYRKKLKIIRVVLKDEAEAYLTGGQVQKTVGKIDANSSSKQESVSMVYQLYLDALAKELKMCSTESINSRRINDFKASTFKLSSSEYYEANKALEYKQRSVYNSYRHFILYGGDTKEEAIRKINQKHPGQNFTAADFVEMDKVIAETLAKRN